MLRVYSNGGQVKRKQAGNHEAVMFSGPPRVSMESRSRTVIVSGVPAALPPDRMVDKLTIHFQRVRRSDGGDVEEVKYPTSMDGVAFVTFYKAEDAGRVVRKEQVMKDHEFPEDYSLTVFPFTTDVYLYVSSTTLDLSVFGSDQTNLIKSLRSAHGSIRFLSSTKQREVLIEGPLSAVKTLRDDLVRRAKDLKLPIQTAAVKPENPSSNLRRTFNPEVVGAEGFSGAKAKQKPWSSSKVRQNSGQDQDVTSKSETQKVLLTQNVSNESLAGERRRHVTGEESKPETVGLSGPELDSVKEKSAKHQRRGSLSKRISTENPLDLSSSATSTNFSQTKLGDTSTEGVKDLSPGNVEDTWVDLYAFEYIRKFHKKELEGCVKDVNMFIECMEGTGLLKISVTEKSKPGSRYLKTAVDNIETLMEYWASFLRVHEIFCDESLTKRTLTLICDEANSICRDVLYMFEDSQIKVIGPSESGHLFCMLVEDSMSKHLPKKVKTGGKNK